MKYEVTINELVTHVYVVEGADSPEEAEAEALRRYVEMGDDGDVEGLASEMTGVRTEEVGP